MLAAVPLTVVLLVIFNLIAFALPGPDPWAIEIFSFPMVSGVRWVLPLGDVLITFALVMLFIEALKSARASASTIADHIVSTLVLIAYVVEFIVVGRAAHPVFFILTVIALFDVVVGLAVSIRTAARGITFGRSSDD